MSRIILSVTTAMLAILLLVGSVPALANSYSYSETPTEASNEGPPESPKGSTITCQGAGNVCPTEGDYKCCDGLDCRPHTVGGISLCLPPLVPEEKTPEYPKCREITKLCLFYGNYQCCGGLSCVPTSQLNPIDVGVCLPIGKNKEEVIIKCQKQLDLCQPYGEYQCCKGFTCADTRTLAYPVALPVDQTKLPPGIGVCIPAKN